MARSALACMCGRFALGKGTILGWFLDGRTCEPCRASRKAQLSTVLVDAVRPFRPAQFCEPRRHDSPDRRRRSQDVTTRPPSRGPGSHRQSVRSHEKRAVDLSTSEIDRPLPFGCYLPFSVTLVLGWREAAAPEMYRPEIAERWCVPLDVFPPDSVLLVRG